MRRTLVVLSLLLPVAELLLLLQVGATIGALPTLGLLALSALGGVAVVRRRGGAAWARAREAARAGRGPETDAAHGGLLVLAGVLLVVPGFLTDLAGLALLVPPVRAHLAAAAVARAAAAGPPSFGPLPGMRVPGGFEGASWGGRGRPAGAPPDVEGQAAPPSRADPQTSPAHDPSDPRARGVLDA